MFLSASVVKTFVLVMYAFYGGFKIRIDDLVTWEQGVICVVALLNQYKWTGLNGSHKQFSLGIAKAIEMEVIL